MLLAVTITVIIAVPITIVVAFLTTFHRTTKIFCDPIVIVVVIIMVIIVT
ncbi:hypothetical protein [Peribacillus muralis]